MDIPSNFNPSLPVVVVGAGFAGLACATKLAQAGIPVTLVESTHYGGGRARSYEDPDIGAAIDNGQHLFMGCYIEVIRLLRRIGTEDKLALQSDLEVTMAAPEGSPFRLRCPTLPAPMHLATGLLTMRGLSVRDRLSVLRLGLVLNQELQRPDDQESCDAWLERMGQSPGLRRIFWDPLIWGALNEDPLVCSASMLLSVIKRGFVSTQRASRFGVAKVGLSELYVEPSLRYLRDHGARLVMGVPVRSVAPLQSSGVKVTLRSRETIEASHVVLAIPPVATAKVLGEPWSHLPAVQCLRDLEHSPIVNLWARLDRPLPIREDFFGMLDSPLHWVFDRGRIEADPRAKHVISATISGARAFVQDSQEQLQALLESELARFFGSKAPKVTAFRAIKERQATLRHAVGTYRQRPSSDLEIPQVYLAGDWVRTGLPATMEGAAQSGHEAADKVIHAMVGIGGVSCVESP